MPPCRPILNQLLDYPIPQLPNSPSSNAPLVLLLEDIGRMKIESRCGARISTPKFSVAPVADGEILQPSVDNEIDERRAGENAVRDEIASEPVEDAAGERAGDHHAQPDLGIEILSAVELGAVTHRTAIYSLIRPQRVADLQPDAAPAASARDGLRLLVAADGQIGVATLLARLKQSISSSRVGSFLTPLGTN